MSFRTYKTFEPDSNIHSKELMDDVRNLWAYLELSNGDITGWEADDDDMDDPYSYAVRFPVLHKYLLEQNMDECYICWSW